MTRSRIFGFICLTSLLLATACSKPAPNSSADAATTPSASPAAKRVTSESVVSVAAQPVEISAGGSAVAVVRMTIKTGYHTNANPPTFSYLKPTELEIKPADGVSLGQVTYPPAAIKRFLFADKPLAVYEGEAELKATLKADKSVKPGQRSIPAQLRIQACDDQLCYAPGTLELAIPVNIK
jgi:DsbC/DsbD-like thiol-disulfide interchange protein